MKVVFITDIPAPYRVEMYNTLQELLPNLEVWYFQRESKTRPWKFKEHNMKHKYWVSGGYYKRIGIYNLHINFNLVFRCLTQQPDHIVLATGWNDVDTLFICILKRLGILKSKISFWSEANYLTIGASRDNIIKYIFRRFIYKSSDGYQLVSGEMTKKTLHKWGICKFNEIYFPNTIEEKVHSLEEKDKFVRKNSETLNILIVARLDEKFKGILNFLNALLVGRLQNVEINIAGSGPDKITIESFIAFNKLDNQIKILGEVASKDLAIYYQRADVFCLPSFSDPSPLSVVEAIQWGLPLLLSNRCGNHYEALIEGRNGFLFDPHSQRSIIEAFDQILERRHDFKSMGNLSRQLFLEKFEKEKVLRLFKEKIES